MSSIFTIAYIPLVNLLPKSSMLMHFTSTKFYIRMLDFGYLAQFAIICKYSRDLHMLQDGESHSMEC